jgi:Outer membrane protein TOM13
MVHPIYIFINISFGSKGTGSSSQWSDSASKLPISQKWEKVASSPSSSYPSMSFPENSDHPSPDRTQPRPLAPRPLSTTLAIFDSSLSTRARVSALLSSLAINLLLPFVNGVMLGFGEIFAKSVIGWFGWKLPGPVVTNVGIGVSRLRRPN